MNREKKKLFETNNMLLLAMEFSYESVDEKEIESIDRTEMFQRELRNIIKNKEILNMNINGNPASGKSTIAVAIANGLSKDIWGHEMKIQQMSRDQEEFMEMQKNPEVHDTVIVIDEWNQLEDTGENSTVEKALMNYMSDVQAQRYIHKISCSPSSSPDKNANIYLEVIQPDKMNKITHCRLIYKFIKAGLPITQILGHVNIDVSEAISLKWYDEYRRRKFEKMGLILEEGIFRPRDMKYAEIILAVVEKMRPMVKLTNINQPMVRGNVEHEFRLKKLPNSIPGAFLATERAYGVLSQWKAYFKVLDLISAKIAKNRKKSDENPTKEDSEHFWLSIDTMKKQADTLMQQAVASEDSYRKMIEIKKKYDTIEMEEE